jgi:hypothetical protein
VVCGGVPGVDGVRSGRLWATLIVGGGTGTRNQDVFRDYCRLHRSRLLSAWQVCVCVGWCGEGGRGGGWWWW